MQNPFPSENTAIAISVSLNSKFRYTLRSITLHISLLLEFISRIVLFLLISSLFDVLDNLLYEETRYFVKQKITQVYTPTTIECYVSNLSKGTTLNRLHNKKITEFVWKI